MGRWSQYEEDGYRLPHGMTRAGYDADTQTYTYRDADGTVYEGEEGNRYGRVNKVSGPNHYKRSTSYLYAKQQEQLKEAQAFNDEERLKKTFSNYEINSNGESVMHFQVAKACVLAPLGLLYRKLNPSECIKNVWELSKQKVSIYNISPPKPSQRRRGGSQRAFIEHGTEKPRRPRRTREII